MGDVDAIYPFGKGDTWEAEQSVRLLRKHFKNLRNIYFIGETIPGVIHIPYVETDKKEINIWSKVLAATFIEGLSDRFLFMNDDHFIQSDFTDIPNYHCGEIKEYPADDYYKTVTNRTIEVLKQKGLKTLNFDCHTPIFFEKEKFQEVFLEFNPKLEITMKSCYANYWGLEGVYEPDLKVKSLMERWEIDQILPGKFCFSTHENCITRDLRDYILQL